MTGVGFEKRRQANLSVALSIAAAEFFLRSPQLGCGFPNGCCRLAEEPHQSLDVLGRGCKEEVLTNELHPT
jgi:hypothetical protein